MEKPVNWREWLEEVAPGLEPDQLVRVVLTLGGGLLIARLSGLATERLLKDRIPALPARTGRRAGFVFVAGLAVVACLQQLGFNLSVILGAAGVLTVALGLAAQTAVSNLVSSLFLMADRPFKVGDQVEINGVEGEVASIDLMSTKIYSFDNFYVRVPNDELLKSKVINRSRFPIRRINVHLEVAYKEDLDQVDRVLGVILESNPDVLDEPTASVRVEGFGTNGVQIRIIAWCDQAKWFALKDRIRRDAKKALDTAGIEIPFAQIVVHKPARSDDSAEGPQA